MEKGWVSLNRKIRDHWLFEEKRTFSKFEAWIDILLSANHTDKEVMIDSKLQTVERGSFITSIRKLCDRWQWSNSKVKKYFEVLEKEKMLVVKSDTKKTVITVVNYDFYQNNKIEKRHENDTEATQKHIRNTSEAYQKHTNNNDNNANNINNNSLPTDINKLNIYARVEREFGRPLSPMEIETIGTWLTRDGYAESLIDLALKEAVLNQAYNLKYIDKILLTWERKNIRTVSAAQENIRKRNERSVSHLVDPPEEELPEVPMYDWVNQRDGG